MKRRTFLTYTGVTAGYSVVSQSTFASASKSKRVPSYLTGYEKLYKKDPRAAALQWFKDAKFGLFLHYGLYSILNRGEWVQLKEKIPVAKYAKLKKKFKPTKFDADFITDLALEAGMKYINITTRHHDSFCLFKTKHTTFNSVNSPAKRDLVKELAQACEKKKLGLCFYYSHGRDWRHPHAPNNDTWGGSARPDYNPPDPAYAYGKDHDLNKYLEFMKAQVTELLTQYGPVAAIWLDGIAVPLSKKGRKKQSPRHRNNAPEFHAQELYDLVHSLQPQVLVSYKQGLLGTEDFFAPEHRARGNFGKVTEICSTLQKQRWGCNKNTTHIGLDAAWKKLVKARKSGANLLLNTGPLPDGSIHPKDVKTLKAMGKRIAAEGFPQG